MAAVATAERFGRTTHYGSPRKRKRLTEALRYWRHHRPDPERIVPLPAEPPCWCRSPYCAERRAA